MIHDASQTTTGMQLRDPDGQRLGCVLRATPDPLHPGIIDILLETPALSLLAAGSGEYLVTSRHDELRYCVQALSIGREDLRTVRLRVASLGEQTIETHDHDEDYLAIPGRQPVRLIRLVIADGQCPKGLHIRCEIAAADLAQLGLQLPHHQRCDCRPAIPEASSVPDDLAAPCWQWDFRKLGQRSGSNPPPVAAQVVRLAQRRTFACTFDIGMPDAGCGEAVLIGHAAATEAWPATPQTPPPPSDAQPEG